MKPTTIRISLATRGKLRSLTSKTEESMQTILDEAVEAYRRQLFPKRANEAFALPRNAQSPGKKNRKNELPGI